MTEVFLEARGDIGSRLQFFYGEKTGKAVAKFGLKLRFPQGGAWHERWFSFVAFDELAEYIGTHYSQGSTIHILKAIPRNYRFIKRDNKVVTMICWYIQEIMDPQDDRGAISQDATPEVVETEFIPDDEEEGKWEP